MIRCTHMYMRRFLLNLFALTPLALVGYYGLPVLLDMSKGPAFQAQIVQLVTHPQFKNAFFAYMALFFGIAFLPIMYNQVRQLIVRWQLRATQHQTVTATITKVHNTGIRMQSGSYAKIDVQLPDGRTTSFYENVSIFQNLHVGNQVRVTYDPKRIKRVMLAKG